MKCFVKIEYIIQSFEGPVLYDRVSSMTGQELSSLYIRDEETRTVYTHLTHVNRHFTRKARKTRHIVLSHAFSRKVQWPNIGAHMCVKLQTTSAFHMFNMAEQLPRSNLSSVCGSVVSGKPSSSDAEKDTKPSTKMGQVGTVAALHTP